MRSLETVLRAWYLHWYHTDDLLTMRHNARKDFRKSVEKMGIAKAGIPASESLLYGSNGEFPD